MGMINIIKTKVEWDTILNKIETYDFYHTYDYHTISKNQEETPVLVVYEEGNILIALPLLIRGIGDTAYYDATSVYGYAGPLTKGITQDFDTLNFQTSLNSYLEEQNIVSVFSRLNPYIPYQETILNGIGAVKAIGKVVNIDLTISLEEQRAAYRRDTKSRVNKARRLCSVKKAETKEDILAFIAIYNETMEKLNADTTYFFDPDYFFNFLSCDGFKTEILLAVHNESKEIAAGSMFVKSNNIIQYHLSGTKSEYMKIAPSRLLLDEMRIQGTQEGYTYFNLGGGYQSKEDALFNFKSSFSNDTKQFKLWTHIVNQKTYSDLCLSAKVGETDFFPAYRATL